MNANDEAISRREMYDAIREFFVALTTLLNLVTPAIDAQLKTPVKR